MDACAVTAKPGSRPPADRGVGPSDEPRVGAVVIGRNEGDRLARCLDSLTAHPGQESRGTRIGRSSVIYVDSASTDGSVELARGRGVETIELDLSIPFTAAR